MEACLITDLVPLLWKPLPHRERRRPCLADFRPAADPCTESGDDRARRFAPPAARSSAARKSRANRPPSCSRDSCPTGTLARRAPRDRARRLSPSTALACTESAYDRARQNVLMPVGRTRTPCIQSADARADKRCTPCSSTDTSPRARTAPPRPGIRGLFAFRFVPFFVTSSPRSLRVLDFPILVERHSHVRPPDRRLHRHEVGAPRTDDSGNFNSFQLAPTLVARRT